MAKRKPSSRPPRRSPWGPWLGLVVLLLAVGIFWWWRTHPVRQQEPTPPPTAKPANQVPVAPVLPVETPVTPPAQTNPPPVVVVTPTNAVPPPARVTNEPPPAPAVEVRPGRRPATNLLEAQIALSWKGISCGPVDGVGGAQTALALKAFQRQQHLEETGWLDRDTRNLLQLERPLHTRLTVTAEDLLNLRPVPATWLGKSQAPTLDHETLLERIAERTQAHPNYLRRLNPQVDWTAVTAGTELVVPNTGFPPARRAALVRVNLAQKWIRAFDAGGDLLAHFPCSIGKIAEKRPVGELHVAVAVKDPNYTFNPEVFPESAEGRQLGRKLVVPPGPNNPVGVAWIGLSKPGYGIHGTPSPEQVGRTESHGCFRLANWNAEFLRRMVSVGTPVWIE